MDKNIRHHIQMGMMVIAAILVVLVAYIENGLTSAMAACATCLILLCGITFLIYNEGDEW